jgi:hypothetical protein
MRSSSDWVRDPSGRWVKAAVQQTRGLNRNVNHTLKGIFKGAATTVIGARQIAAIVLALWRSGEAYDPKTLEAKELHGPESMAAPRIALTTSGPTNRKRTGYRGEHPLDFWAGPGGPSRGVQRATDSRPQVAAGRSSDCRPDGPAVVAAVAFAALLPSSVEVKVEDIALSSVPPDVAVDGLVADP